MRGGLEELDQIAGRVLDEDLRPAGAGDDVVAEAQARGAQAVVLGGEAHDDELDPVPAAGDRPAAIRNGRPAELVRPLSNSRSPPRRTSANAGATFVKGSKPRWPVYQSTAAWTSSTR